MIFFRVILYPFTLIYGILIGIRNFLFDKSIFTATRVPAKVVSVGNITVGGSGKTPAVNMLAQMLKDNNRKAAVLSRGYGRRSRGYLLVSDGRDMLTTVEMAGDEIFLTASECRVPAAVCESRVEGAQKLLSEITADVILLDDAFQHRWLRRDLDIVIFDQRFLISPDTLEQNLLPAGIMREYFDALDRADVIIINRKFSLMAEPLPTELMKFFTGKKIFTAYYCHIGLIDVRNFSFYPVEEFQGQKSLVVSGIAHPESFLSILNRNNIDTSNQLIFSDHKHYTHKEIQTIRKSFYTTNSHSVITTQKDAVKLTRFSQELDDIDIYYLKIQMQLDDEKSFRDFLLSKI